MNTSVRKWIEKDGVEFLREIGVQKDQTVLDFGCGKGHYTIPAAKVVGAEGKVYGFDKDKNALRELEETGKRFGLKNIELISGDTKVPLEDKSVDVALLYDVIHYEKNRGIIYQEIHRVLRQQGILSIYPKHYKNDYPLMELAEMEMADVKREIEECDFYLWDKILKELLHDDYYNKGYVLNFRKKT